MSGSARIESIEALKDLRKLPPVTRCYTFGEYHHLLFDEQMVDIGHIKTYLQKNQHNDIVIKKIPPTIEDCFMELMRPDVQT